MFTSYALFKASSLCDWVAQIPLRTLSSRSSTVRLFTTKYLSFDSDGSSTSLVSSVSTSSSLGFVSLPGEGLRATVGAGGGAKAAGPVGIDTPAVAPAEFLRNRLTSRTLWNLESWILSCAAAQAASSLKFANAQLLFDIRNRESSPTVSLQTWRTRLIRSVCGGKFPIQIAWPIQLLVCKYSYALDS